MTRTTLQRRAPVLAMAVALLLVAMMVTRTSQAAFTATTDNSGNSFTAGTVVLTDDDLEAAMFTVPAMSPGDTATGCIQVTYSGTITDPQAVKLYGGGYTDAGGSLSDHLELTVLEGAADSTCATWTTGTTIVNGSTLAAFNDTDSTDYASGDGAWTPTSTPETRAYQFTVKLADATPNTEQGASTSGVAFVWEIQS